MRTIASEAIRVSAGANMATTEHIFWYIGENIYILVYVLLLLTLMLDVFCSFLLFTLAFFHLFYST